MAKNMYSLILTDSVIDRVDRLAYERGISRSQMIDHILANAVGFATPEQKMRALVKRTADHISSDASGLQLHIRGDFQGMDATTYVKYKYNPTIKYHVDVYQEDGNMQGTLKISSRSTSSDLRAHLDDFIELFDRIDADANQLYKLKEQREAEEARNASAQRFARTIQLNKLFADTEDPEQAAPRLSRSIALLDEAIQYYFASLGNEDEEELRRKLTELYLRKLSE